MEGLLIPVQAVATEDQDMVGRDMEDQEAMEVQDMEDREIMAMRAKRRIKTILIITEIV